MNSSHDEQRSRFTYRHLSQLRSYSTTTPLRVIAHVDLDAFYAQCETIRLGLPPTTPLAVQQWQSLIAINYPARAFGLSRHITCTDAVKLCPELRLQHVATWKEGETKPAYHEDAFKNMAMHKVSLDPYRMESRKILKCIKGCLPEKEQRVEKASIDEVFLDLSAQIHTVLMERFPELKHRADNEDPAECLPKPPTTALDWATDELVATGEGDEGEEKDPDWDDVCMAIGSEIVRHVRENIRKELGYTCSAGVARNKMLSKIGSGYKKPNQQTVIRNRSIRHFMAEMKFTKIRMLGGKLGDEIAVMFNTEMVKDLLEQPLEQLKKLGDDTGIWLYSTIRGEDNSEVNPRTQIKSMLSAKAFRPAINSFEQGVRWIRIFVADIFSRCVEEGVLENRRRPKTINLHHRQAAQTRSKSCPIPNGKPFSEDMLFDLAKNLLAQVVVDGRAWPCANLSLAVHGFEDGITNNHGIGGFLVRGEKAKALLASERHDIEGEDAALPPAKRRRKECRSLHKFFTKDTRTAVEREHCISLLKEESSKDQEHEEEEDVDSGEDSEGFEPLPLLSESGSIPPLKAPTMPVPKHDNTADDHYNSGTPPSAQPQPQSQPDSDNASSTHQFPAPSKSAPSKPSEPFHQPSPPAFFCPRCSTSLPSSQEAEHTDWHFAKDLAKELQAQERSTHTPQISQNRSTPVAQKASRGKGRPPGSSSMGRGSRVEKGQARLAFGKG
ncbi:DNA/RNA polymerase [Delitschia confertaspora ATCC 74209]|uniref:DNA polymerase eta n=1 Tax=Delitschia confertaspora ATCC 74209 TaxID=1513339 RepID=A0A9P4MZX4_9PLEO|nr:DNA/RNA polymerase [Delitschia confertaspora ATCC 74209]